MIKDLIKQRFLNDTTDEHDCYVSICEANEWNPDSEDLYQTFKADYDAVIESDWWGRVQREQRMNEWVGQQVRDTEDEIDLEIRNQTVNKYG